MYPLLLSVLDPTSRSGGSGGDDGGNDSFSKREDATKRTTIKHLIKEFTSDAENKRSLG